MSQLRWHSAILALFTGLGVVAGLAIDVVIAGRYGLSETADAYYIAATLPVILLAVALSAGQNVLVVALTDDGQSPPGEKVRLLAALLTHSGIISLGVALVGSLSAPWLMGLLAPGRGESTFRLAAQLGAILFWRTPAAWCSELLRAALYARHRFIAAAAGYFIPGLVALILTLAFPGRPIATVAWAITLGNWIGLLWTGAAVVSVLRQEGVIWRWTFHHPDVRPVGRALLAPLAGLLARQSVTLAERFFGSFLPPGSIAALGYANKITLATAGVALDSLITAALPGLTRTLAGTGGPIPRLPKDPKGFGNPWGLHSLAVLLRPAGVLSLGLAMGLGLLGQALARFPGLAWGALDAQGLALLGDTLTFYSLALLPLGPLRMVQAWWYAARRPERAAALMALAAGVTVMLDWPFSQLWGTAGLGLGLTAGLTVALAVGWRWTSA